MGKECEMCNGEGQYTCDCCDGNGVLDCEYCDGSGEEDGERGPSLAELEAAGQQRLI